MIDQKLRLRNIIMQAGVHGITLSGITARHQGVDSVTRNTWLEDMGMNKQIRKEEIHTGRRPRTMFYWSAD